MSLSTTLDSLKKSLSRAHSERIYSEARPRHRVLASYETVGAVLSAVSRGSRVSIEERDALFAAIVTELQVSSDPFWQSLLLVTFTPMLARVRAALRRPGSDDVDQSVLLAFLETARSLKDRRYVARNLRLMTQKRLFAERRRERRVPELQCFEDETYAGDPFGVDANARAAAAEVVRLVEAEGGEELRELLLGTCADDRSVKEYVDRAYADCSERIRSRTSKRLRRARIEVFSLLRTRAKRRDLVRARAA